MPMNAQTALARRLKKVRLLGELLGDPEIAAVARTILATPDIGVPMPKPNIRKGRTGRGKRGLKKKALDIVKRSTAPLSAKEVAEAMEREGFTFESVDKAVAVSKALRTLAKSQKIGHKKGDRPKDAIMYTRLPTLVPVQERTQ
jgi:hypothetical protein